MVILLNGSINSGKTTIGKEIAAMGVEFAHVEVDDLRHFISWVPLQESIEVNLKNAASVVKNFHEYGISSVVTYPLSVSDFEFIGALLKNYEIEYCAVSLYPGIDKLKSNRGSRELSLWELNRIDELHSDGIATPDFGITIDNSNLSVRETALKVLAAAGLNKLLHHITQ